MSDIKIKTAKEFDSIEGKITLESHVLFINAQANINSTAYASDEAKAAGGVILKGAEINRLNQGEVKKLLIHEVGKVLQAQGNTIEYDFILNQIWAHDVQIIRCFLFHSDFSALMDSAYGVALLSYCHENNIIRVLDNNGIWLYLTTLEPDHRALLEEFKAIIQDKPE